MVGNDLHLGRCDLLHASIRRRALSAGCHLWGIARLWNWCNHGIYVSQADWFDYLR